MRRAIGAGKIPDPLGDAAIAAGSAAYLSMQMKFSECSST
jgi:hypothetical protein